MKKFDLKFKDKMINSVLQVEGSKFVQLSLDPGKGLTKHHTPNHLTLIVLEGQVEFAINEEKEILNASDVIVVEPSVEHEVHAIEKSVVLLVLTPPVKVEADTPEPRTFVPDHDNAYNNPAILESIAPEIRQLTEDHIELCKKLYEAQTDLELHDIATLLKLIGEELDRHFVAEEKVLFPYIAAHLGGDDVGPVPRLLEEHEIIRRLHRDTKRLYEGAKDQTDSHAKLLVGDRMRELSHVLINHLGKEDSHLFPMASRILTEAELQSVAEGLQQYN